MSAFDELPGVEEGDATSYHQLTPLQKVQYLLYADTKPVGLVRRSKDESVKHEDASVQEVVTCMLTRLRLGSATKNNMVVHETSKRTRDAFEKTIGEYMDNAVDEIFDLETAYTQLGLIQYALQELPGKPPGYRNGIKIRDSLEPGSRADESQMQAIAFLIGEDVIPYDGMHCVKLGVIGSPGNIEGNTAFVIVFTDRREVMKVTQNTWEAQSEDKL